MSTSTSANNSFNDPKGIQLCGKTENQFLRDLKTQQDYFNRLKSDFDDFLYESGDSQLKSGLIKRTYKDKTGGVIGIYEGEVKEKKRHGRGKYLKTGNK